MIDTGLKPCPLCGEIMEQHDSPDIKLEIKIPFTDYTIQLWDWGNKEYMCIDCMTEKYDEPYKDAYEQGCADGFNESEKRHSSF